MAYIELTAHVRRPPLLQGLSSLPSRHTALRLGLLFCIVVLLLGGAQGRCMAAGSTHAAATADNTSQSDNVVSHPKSGSIIPPIIRLQAGDKIRLSFYEKLKDAEGRWANLQAPVRPQLTFYLHTELSGDFSVGTDDRIRVPLLGTFIAAGVTPEKLTAELRTAFTRAIRRPGFVDLQIVKRQPIYVLGPVKKPGVYDYQAGLTPLHIVALAGGLLRNQLDRSAAVEAIRQSGQLARDEEHLKRLLADEAVLRAELDKTAVHVPQLLARIASPAEAQALIAQAQAQQAVVATARKERRQSMDLAVAAAQRALEAARARIRPWSQTIALKKARSAALAKLFNSGTVSRVMLLEAQSGLSDATGREADARTAVADAEQQLAVATLEQAKFKSDTTIELQKKIAGYQQKIDNLEPSLKADAGILRFLRPEIRAPLTERDVVFQVVRQTATGPHTFTAQPTTVLQPGDLVQVISTRPREPLRRDAQRQQQPEASTASN